MNCYGGQKKRKYQYDPHLDPQLQCTGKAEQASFEAPTVSLHVHERIDPRQLTETVKIYSTGGGEGARGGGHWVYSKGTRSHGGKPLYLFKPLRL